MLLPVLKGVQILLNTSTSHSQNFTCKCNNYFNVLWVYFFSDCIIVSDYHFIYFFFVIAHLSTDIVNTSETLLDLLERN